MRVGIDNTSHALLFRERPPAPVEIEAFRRSIQLDPRPRWRGRIQDRRRDAYDAYALAYLHARARIEKGDLAGARALLEPFLAPGHALRDLALYYRAEVAQEEGEPEEASRFRQELIFTHTAATYRSAAIAEEASYLAEEADAARLGVFLVRLAATVEPATRRLVEARLVERLVKEGQDDAALQRALRLLRENGTDDAADSTAAAATTPAADETTPPADATTPPADATTPPADTTPDSDLPTPELGRMPLQDDTGTPRRDDEPVDLGQSPRYPQDADVHGIHDGRMVRS